MCLSICSSKWSSAVTQHRSVLVPRVCVLFYKSIHFSSLILNTMLLMQAAVSLCYKVTGFLLMHATCSGIFSVSCGLAVILLDFILHLCPQTLDLSKDFPGSPEPRKTAMIRGPEMQSTALGVSLDPVFLSATPGWEAVNTTTTEKKNSPSPHFSCQRASFHTEPTLVRQQLKPGSSGGGMGACEPQIYKLDFYPFTSCSLLSTHQLRRRRLCGLHVRCNYDHFHQRCITHDREELSGDTYDPVTNGWAVW